MINISYSAFDSFQIPGLTYKDRKQIHHDMKKNKGRYIYCGIRDICKEIEFYIKDKDIDANSFDDDILNDKQNYTFLKPIDEMASEFASILGEIFNDVKNKKIYFEVLNILSNEPSLVNVYEKIKTNISTNTVAEYFSSLSTGHKFVLHSVANIVLHLEKRSLILFDEPETHLHPPLLAVLMSAIRWLLEKKDAFAIIATHSPVVVQETISKNVNIISRSGDYNDFSRPEIETFGENIGLITSSVFSLTSQVTDYHAELDNLIDSCSTTGSSISEILSSIEAFFDTGLSMQGKAYVMTKLVSKE